MPRATQSSDDFENSSTRARADKERVQKPRKKFDDEEDSAEDERRRDRRDRRPHRTQRTLQNDDD